MSGPSGRPWLARRKAESARTKALRAERIAIQNAVIRDWWPKASAREIGMMVDLTAQAVVQRAQNMGFSPRPISAKPEGA